MSTVLSHRLGPIKLSITLRLAAKAHLLKKQGQAIINLGVGEPDFDTPLHIKAAAIAAIEQGYTKYTATEGLLELRAAICQKFMRENQLHYNPDQILVSCGAKQSFFNAIQALINPGDEVIIPAPYWVSYPDIVRLAEGAPVFIETHFDQHFKITPAQLEQAITPRTKVFLINSPSNPTGVAYTHRELQALGSVMLKYPHIWVITDDIYEHSLWRAESFSNILNACPELYERTLVLNGVSKAYAMTGWRIGFTAGPKTIIDGMNTIQSQSTSNACSVSQMATIAALTGDQSCIQLMNKAFKERHDYLIQALNNIPGIECHAGDGTFYVFAKVEGLIKHLGLKNDEALCDFLLEQTQIVVVPGSAFGTEGYVRLSFATSLQNLEEMICRLKRI